MLLATTLAHTIGTLWGPHQSCLFYYKGQDENGAKIQLNIEFGAPEVSGAYLEENNGVVYSLAGHVQPKEQQMVLSVYDENQSLVAKLVAEYDHKDDSKAWQIRGKLFFVSGKQKPVGFTVRKVAEYAYTAPAQTPPPSRPTPMVGS